MLAPRRSQRRVRAPGLQGKGPFMPGGERKIMATPSGRERIAVRLTILSAGFHRPAGSEGNLETPHGLVAQVQRQGKLAIASRNHPLVHWYFNGLRLRTAARPDLGKRPLPRLPRGSNQAGLNPIPWLAPPPYSQRQADTIMELFPGRRHS
jgi:hypothetical protein